ncbi:MAG: glycosyltransferase family 4 protein [candidate division SR1 bacterium]|nr:glycosyltransferase family 4 protein [candidate division SR1 bacterium]
MSKHILFVLDYYTPHRGGSETVFQNVISRLLAKGYQISILTSRFDSSLAREEHHDQLSIYRTAKSRLGFVFAAFFRGRKILKKNKDIHFIHTSTYGGAIPASLLGLIFHKKVILTVHEIFGKLRYVYKGFVGGLLYKFFERSIFYMPYSTYHCVSQNTMNDIHRVYKIPLSKIHMIYNGVDTEFRNPKHVSESDIVSRKSAHGRDNRYVVLYFGHAGKSKGLDYLVAAVPEILKQNSNILCVFNIIDSKRTKFLESKILQTTDEDHKIKIRDNSKIQLYKGFDQSQLRTVVAAANLIVAPSLSEGFGSVHTEVVALGKPLLTTTAGPIPEVVRGNVKLIQPANVDQIISSVLDFSHNRITENIPEKEFSRDATVDEIEKLYN